MKCNRYSVLNASKTDSYFRYLDCGQQSWIDMKISGEQLVIVEVVDGNISSANRNVLINLYDDNNIPNVVVEQTPITLTEEVIEETAIVEETPTTTPPTPQKIELVTSLIASSLWDAYLIGQTFSSIRIVNNSVINFVMKPNLSLNTGETILLYYDNENQMIGEVLSYNSKTGSVSFNSAAILGEGSYFIWKVYKV